jgi:hypothetical protein
MLNAPTHYKNLYSLLLLLLVVPNIIVDKIVLQVLIFCCLCQDTRLRILLSFSFFVSAQPIMPGVSKRRRHSRTAQACKKRKERLANS